MSVAMARMFGYTLFAMSPFQKKRFLPRHTVSPVERERLMRAIRKRLLEEPDILFASLHGSFVTEESSPEIDIGLFTGVAKDLSFESDLSFQLSKAIGYDIDVRVINDAPVAFQMAALRDGRLLLSRNDDARADFIEKVGRRYREYAHFRNVFMEAVHEEDAGYSGGITITL